MLLHSLILAIIKTELPTVSNIDTLSFLTVWNQMNTEIIQSYHESERLTNMLQNYGLSLSDLALRKIETNPELLFKQSEGISPEIKFLQYIYKSAKNNPGLFISSFIPQQRIPEAVVGALQVEIGSLFTSGKIVDIVRTFIEKYNYINISI